MILEKLNGLIYSINRNFHEALQHHAIKSLPDIFEMNEYVVADHLTPYGHVEYHIELWDRFHNMRVVTSMHSVAPEMIPNNKRYVIELSQELFYTELTKYMMFMKSSTYINSEGFNVRLWSLADILEDILKQHKTGGFTDVDLDWLHQNQRQLGHTKRLENG